ncbi:hypothetical protein ACP275_10G056500 [Erythranthe tilingii]
MYVYIYMHDDEDDEEEDDRMQKIATSSEKKKKKKMDTVFLLGEGDRAAFLRQMMHSFGSVYVCLWSYLPHPSNCLLALDGICRELADERPSSSAGSLGRRLFDVYRESVNYVDSGRVPGLAFKSNIPYMELNLHDLQRLASNQVQLQFYQEAGIKTALFMGCATGEIELGMSNDPHVDLQMQMKNLFPADFSRPAGDPNQPPSSSSSSLRSLSVESPPEYSPLVLSHNIPSTTSSFLLEPSKQAAATITITSPHHDHHRQIRNVVNFPRTETEDAAMTKAILAVLSSPSTTSSTNNNNSQPTSHNSSNNPSTTAFTRNLNIRRSHELLQVQGNRPNTTQLHHMISERRRREKLNESFLVLRSLLPPGTKRDKASVLSGTTKLLSSLKSQVEELRQRNQMLESKISSSNLSDQVVVGNSSFSSSVDHQTRVSVEITQVQSPSTSDARLLDLRVRVRGERSMLDSVIRIMEFLKQQRNVISVLSVESNTRMFESVPVHWIVLRLKIEGDEFDESAFQEAVRRVVDDLAD